MATFYRLLFIAAIVATLALIYFALRIAVF
jgi:hypothetical protein